MVCIDPATMGMVANDHGRWGFPGTAEARERLAALRRPGEDSAIPG